jgi:hydroxymethylbilane synthase
VTLEEVQRERKAFNEYGGGCHLAVGIHVRKFGPYFLHFHKGQVDHKEIKKRFLEPSPNIKTTGPQFIGMDDDIIQKIPLECDLSSHNNYLVSSRHCLHALKSLPPKTFLWSAGSKTHQKLTKEGFWVNGCADSFGMTELSNFLESGLIKLFMENHGINAQIKILTNDLSLHKEAPSVATYTRKVLTPTAENAAKIRSTKVFYWASLFQYQKYVSLFPELLESDRVHTCGLGKTWNEFESHGLNVIPLPGPDFLKTLN